MILSRWVVASVVCKESRYQLVEISDALRRKLYGSFMCYILESRSINLIKCGVYILFGHAY